MFTCYISWQVLPALLFNCTGLELATEEHYPDCVSPWPPLVLCVLTYACRRRGRGAGGRGGGQRQGEEEEGGTEEGSWGTLRGILMQKMKKVI